MTGSGVRAAIVGAIGMLALAGCGSDATATGTSGPGASGEEPPAYCAPAGSGDEEFWEVVNESCSIAQDGDLLQADALRQVLADAPTKDVAAFHRTFVRVNHALRSSTDVSDDICVPDHGLGDDLSTDYRSWIVAHGQSAYDAVRADPELLRTFPDAVAGCGLGEPFGAAAFDLYLERTGLRPATSGLPLLEVPARS